ncbi:type 4 prepilin-like proteins leader peptide-processing enzyme [Clostridium homopropionicum DSM 5847]|uniref:Type 4 prepilin-like proteins leader peptide-processing enzyme n=1 Tax=Clostridium homopropionicum DSM 5847 TaxID=1121318 RepID=A0A0L6ZEL0_9CLOT|nr:A24 family peptidase [Clostridium homopropionicum]KOA21411.1 type 4 prepilin-like proteins leader peptide-processing enzyme [Clostridium homopropionicum DSM 5847]SFG10745.1 type 4 prepilin peptidase 1 . Aspartic peptidase. MEROPS family A24A [Clostridium homopropionicum]
MIELIVFLLGLSIGSFLNVCIYRIPRGESISFPPSHCTNCNKSIKAYDLVPVVSYIFLKGRCRYCGEKISIKYPLIELITGIVFVVIYIKYGLTIECLKFFFLVSFLILVGIIDYNSMDVYAVTIHSALICGLFFLGVNMYMNLPVKTYIIGAIIGGGVIAIIIILFGGMGWGDAEMCAFCGLYIGVKLTLLMLFLSVNIGAIVAVTNILLKRKTRKDPMPLCPSIAFGTFICIIWGEKILTWYFNNLLFF